MNEMAAHPFKCNVSKVQVDPLDNDDLVHVFSTARGMYVQCARVYLNLHASDMQAEKNLTGINDCKSLEL